MSENIVFKRIKDSSNANDIIDLQNKVMASLGDHTDYFYPDSEEYFISIIRDVRNYCLGVYDQDRFIGVGILYVPCDNEDNLGRDLGFDNDELLKVSHMEMAMVLPDYQGKGIGRNLVQQRVDWALSEGYSKILSTVHPNNTPSLRNLLSAGFEVIVPNILKYGGRVRSILQYNINENG